LGDQIEKFERAGHAACMRKKKSIYRILVGKHEGKRPPGRPMDRWEGNIKMDLHKVKCGGMDCIKLAQDRDTLQALVNSVMNLRVP